MSFQIVSSKPVMRKRLADSKLLQYAKKNRDEGFFNDVTVRTVKKSIAANRMVLSCYSKYFETMFKTSFKQRYANTVNVEGAPETAVKVIIDYFYSESIEIKDETVMDLIAASDYLQVDDVKQFCFDFLQSNISQQNCFLIMNAAITFGNNLVEDQILQYIGQNFEALSQAEEFQTLSKSDVASCLSKLGQNQVKQMSIYQALIIWIKHDKTTREKEFSELFEQLVDIEKLSIMDVKEVLLNEHLITENSNIYKLVLSAFSKRLDEKSASFPQQHFSKVVSLGGWYTGLKVCDVYDSHSKVLQTYPDLPDMIRFACSLKLNDHVFSIGGDICEKTFGANPSKKVWQLNLKSAELQWHPIASMLEKRCAMGAAVHKNGLVVAGGYNGKENITSVEFYEVETKRWTLISSMKQSRSGHQLVSCNDGLFVLGGNNEFIECLSSVARLCDLNKKWEELTPMQTPRKCFAAVNCSGVIYAIGGVTSSNHKTKSVEKYNAVADTWSYVSEMKIERFYHSAAVLNEKIIVIGGFNKNRNHVIEIECYDPSDNTWSIVGRTNDRFTHHSTVIIEE